jgi:hypothetical protein
VVRMICANNILVEKLEKESTWETWDDNSEMYFK